MGGNAGWVIGKLTGRISAEQASRGGAMLREQAGRDFSLIRTGTEGFNDPRHARDIA